ncbi:hypothetical protein F5Y00DRAFT_264270 [Daldinia vernicosa]|uniref:uncharacterized protein n=1 Tax=Daldinia vernicosa TaxID=114800 RepID=UPI00200887FF|nr:uncharacterized protein F5Y00DRAFT_264270 [Daldinia vernicosa]KAI0846656.1 hypothetical protein F5Y00DRAFT_264270 [Daldinia vernicosa]
MRRPKHCHLVELLFSIRISLGKHTDSVFSAVRIQIHFGVIQGGVTFCTKRLELLLAETVATSRPHNASPALLMFQSPTSVRTISLPFILLEPHLLAASASFRAVSVLATSPGEAPAGEPGNGKVTHLGVIFVKASVQDLQLTRVCSKDGSLARNSTKGLFERFGLSERT